MDDLLAKLQGTDRRSIGRSEEVVADVLENPGLFGIVFEGMLSDDPVVRLRSADAVGKITARHPEYLIPFKRRVLKEVASVDQQEVRWHAAQLISRLDLDAAERQAAVGILLTYLADKSSIVKTCSMQALADIAEADPRFRASVVRRLEKLTRTGTPAMKSRGRKLLAKLKQDRPRYRS